MIRPHRSISVAVALVVASGLACGGVAEPGDDSVRAPSASSSDGAELAAPDVAATGAVPGLSLGMLQDVPSSSPLIHPVAPLERDEHVRAPDDLTVATVTVADPDTLGLVDRSTDPPTLRLSQAPCRFVEAEPDADWQAVDAAGCRGVHQEQFDGRGHRALRLEAGAWQIAVTNASVEHVVGLWLRSEDRSAPPLVSSGGVAPGETLVWSVELTPGRYLYSCPLNPTANYLIEVP